MNVPYANKLHRAGELALQLRIFDAEVQWDALKKPAEDPWLHTTLTQRREAETGTEYLLQLISPQHASLLVHQLTCYVVICACSSRKNIQSRTADGRVGQGQARQVQQVESGAQLWDSCHGATPLPPAQLWSHARLHAPSAARWLPLSDAAGWPAPLVGGQYLLGLL